MKTVLQICFGLLLCSLPVTQLRAGDYTFGVHFDPKKFDSERKEAVDKIETKEHWGYAVTIENKTFKDVPNLEIKYLVFEKADKPKASKPSDMKLKQTGGTQAIPLFKKNDKFTFTTEPLELKMSELKGGWHYTDGG